MAVRTTVQKWGNSLGLRIPRDLARDAGVRRGTRVELHVEGNRLVVRATRRHAYSLDELLRRVKADRLHGEVATGPRRGREAW